jgi:two-component system response regulator DevR
VTRTLPIRLLTIDALPLVHAGVRQFLAAFPDIEPVGEARSLAEGLRVGALRAPTLVLAEIDDLGPDWPDAIRRLTGALHAPVAVFTLRVDAETARRAIEAGAQGFLLKDTQPLALAEALRGIAAGQQVFDPEIVRAAFVPQPRETPSERLSQREREVLTLLARGLSNQEIGTRLHVSRATVKFHCGQIFAKLGVQGRAQAVAAAYSRNLVSRLLVEGEGAVAPLHISRGERQIRSA